MIHQTYHLPEDRTRCFPHAPYRPFNLSDLGLSPAERDALGEHAALRYFHQYPDADPDPTIGFTSVNQRTDWLFPEDLCVLDFLIGVDVLSWGYHEFGDAATRQPLSQATVAEACHPGLTLHLAQALALGGISGLPLEYTCDSSGHYCNYWSMRKADFHAYLTWLTPLMEMLLARTGEPFFQRWPRGVGYILERCFGCWLVQQGKQVKVLNTPHVVGVFTQRKDSPVPPSPRSAALPGAHLAR